VKRAVVIHPRFTVYGGAEIIALHIIKTLQELDYEVSIVTDNYNPAEIERNYRMGKVLENTKPILVPPFKPVLSRFLALQHLRYSKRVMRVLRGLQPNIAFSTQSVIYYVPNVKTYQIVYDMADLFEIVPEGGPLSSVWKKPYYRLLRQTTGPKRLQDSYFVPLSQALEKRLDRLGLPHSPVVFPPCDMIFEYRPKKPQVCLVTRIAPQKNVAEFFQIAEHLQGYRFILVGAEADKDPTYARTILGKKPSNVVYIEARIRDRPEVVEESKVYLYTSREPGIGIALGQAMGGGCIPIVPATGGGAEMVAYSGVGYTYGSIDEAVHIVKTVMDGKEARNDPIDISKKAQVFSSENFHRRIMDIVNRESDLGQIRETVGTST